MRQYAKSTEDVMNYLASRYGIEFEGRNPWERTVYLKNEFVAKFGGVACDCGETYGCTIFDADVYEVEEIVICESCYENSDYGDRI